ncbi:C50 carotenoid glucosyltransferase CrtX [Leifsonia kafniensis]|uniref:C50 carotenoid glucosyltransferase CrtX n=1 Tax=Leifsonia kafniensis TaxID=475957 RepID=A0ABP7L5E7_9MICO
MVSITVVIPCFNDAPFLERALAALAVQTRLADEVIVVDNGSTDASASVARAAGARLVSEPVHGIWPAAAAGYDAASGDLIARIDADSVVPGDWLAQIEAEFLRSPEIDVLTGPGRFYDCSPVVAALGEHLYIGGYFWFMSWWLTQPPIFGSNFAMRRQLWRGVREQVHRTIPNVHDDLDLSYHLDPSAVVVYRSSLRVGISARPFNSFSGFFRRIGWAFRTMQLHWSDESPLRRRQARRAMRAGQTGHIGQAGQTAQTGQAGLAGTEADEPPRSLS